MCDSSRCLRGLGPGTRITITGTVVGLADQGREVELRLDNGTPEGLAYFLPLDTVTNLYLEQAHG